MMQIQKSFDPVVRTIGTLYVVPTPIGNLEDITIRALNILKQVDLVAAEDTRNTRKLLNHYEISQPLVSYHEHSGDKKEQKVVQELLAGKHVALVSDAGMPAVSDPGNPLIDTAINESIPVVVLPGATAGLCALVASGLDTSHFYFYGFLPRKNKDKKEALSWLGKLPDTIVLYESPYRIKDTLADLYTYCGNRQIAIGRELTKRFEEYIRGSLEEAMTWAETGTLKGEFCIVIEGNVGTEELLNNDTWWKGLSLVDHVQHYINQEELSSKAAIKQVAAERDLPKREVYQAYHVEN